MMEELERSHIDRNSPIWGGIDCNYFDLTIEVQSYWIMYFKKELNLKSEGGTISPIGIEGKDVKVEGVGTIKEYTQEETEEHNRIMSEFEDGYTVYTELKSQEYFRELWRDVSKVGFEREDRDHCIETCKTLIREEVDWWKERADLKELGGIKLPSLVECFSWYVIWRQCKYEELVAHPLYIYASNKQKTLKENLPQNAPRKSIKLKLNNIQLEDFYQGLKDLRVFATKHKDGEFKEALNGSEHSSILEPMKFKDDKVLSLIIKELRDNLLIDGNPQYPKWQLFFGINQGRARRLVSDYGKLAKLGAEAKTHRSLPEEYSQIKNLIKSLVG